MVGGATTQAASSRVAAGHNAQQLRRSNPRTTPAVASTIGAVRRPTQRNNEVDGPINITSTTVHRLAPVVHDRAQIDFGARSVCGASGSVIGVTLDIAGDPNPALTCECPLRTGHS
jgi:hypothetical protein